VEEAGIKHTTSPQICLHTNWEILMFHCTTLEFSKFQFTVTVYQRC